MLHARIDDSLTIDTADVPSVGVWQLVGSHAGSDVVRDAFAWSIATWCEPDASPFVPGLGLDYPAFTDLLRSMFPQFSPPADWLAEQGRAVGRGGALDEFHDLVGLLTEHRAVNDEYHRRLAHLVATACMGNDHLWQDLGLPRRNALTELMAQHFPTLAARNDKDMKWKKFLYRLLCEREGYVMCSRPSCADCADYRECFGPEE